ncbi:ribonuclease P protein component [Planctomycetota bacterium]
MKRFSFSKSKRLVKNEQFKTVLAQKRRFSDNLLTLYIAENDIGHSRLGISVGKSLGFAVIRNRLKRLLREAFRQNQEQLPSGYDYLLMISAQWSKKLDRNELCQAVKQPGLKDVQKSLLKLVSEALDSGSSLGSRCSKHESLDTGHGTRSCSDE